MENNICCFAGHGKPIYGTKTRNKVLEKCRELITDFDVEEFWVGNYGNFDQLAAGVVRELKEQYPDVQLNLIIPYLTKEINNNREYYDKAYDNIIMANIPTGTPNRYRILSANKFMVNSSSYLIACVDYGFGGAAKTLEYAREQNDRRNNIQIFNLGELWY